MDSSPSSSPDPLALSILSSHGYGKHSAPRSRSRRPLSQASPNPGRIDAISFQPKGDGAATSQSITLNTPSRAGTSPWRIRVTVQAEPDEQGMVGDGFDPQSPSAMRSTRRNTITVPIKGSDGSSPVKRRGRPQKSDGEGHAHNKRDVTPARAKVPRRRRGSSVASTKTPEIAGQNLPSPSKRGRGRPRKSLPNAEDSTIHSQGDPAISNVDEETQQRNLLPQVRAEPRAAPPRRSTFDFAKLTPLHEKYVVPSPQYRSPPPLTPNPTMKPVKGRRPTPVRPPGWSEEQLSPLPPSSPPIQEEVVLKSVKDRKGTPVKPSVLSAPHDDDLEDASMDDDQDAHSYYGAADAISDDDSDLDDAGINNEQDLLDVKRIETTIGEKTLRENEGFSMISIGSLPSRRQVVDSPGSEKSTSTSEETSISGIINGFQMEYSFDPSIKSPERGDNDVYPQQSTYPIQQSSQPSPPARSSHSQTPNESASVPSDPPPIEQPHFSSQKPTTPKLARVVKAGIALQGVLEPKPETAQADSSAPRPVGEQKERLDNLFSGFGEGTCRELRAGLRLGEQIAMRMQRRELGHASSPQDNLADKSADENVFGDPGAMESVESGYSRLPTPEGKNDYSLAAPSFPDSGNVHYPSLRAQKQQVHLVSPDSSSNLAEINPLEARASEAIGAIYPVQDASRLVSNDLTPSLERDSGQMDCYKVSNQQQIGHDLAFQETEIVDNGSLHASEDSEHSSDAESEENENDSREEDGGALDDLWHQEANRSAEQGQQPDSVLKRSSPEIDELQADQNSLMKPRRSKIPRIWRKKSSNNFIYSDELASEGVASPEAAADELPIFTNVSSTRDGPVLDVRQSHDFNPSLVSTELLPSSPVSSANETFTSDVRQLRSDMERNYYEDYDQDGVADEQGEDELPSQIDSFTELGEENESTREMKLSHEDDSSATIAQQPVPERAFPSYVNVEARASLLPDKQNVPAAPAQAPTQGIFGRLWSTLTFQSAPPAPDPIIAQYRPLPRIEPWTKTHYKVLDQMYQVLKRDAFEFSPHNPANPPLPAAFKREIGTTLSNWGYTATLTAEHMVLAARYMRLLVTDSHEGCEMGDCCPGEPGTRITEWTVCGRLWSVIVGEDIRRDEKLGIPINRVWNLVVTRPRA